MNMEDEARNSLLKMDQKQMADVANACNRYPSVEVEFEIMNSPEEILSEESIAIKVMLEREDEDEDYSELVTAPYFPKVAPPLITILNP